MKWELYVISRSLDNIFFYRCIYVYVHMCVYICIRNLQQQYLCNQNNSVILAPYVSLRTQGKYCICSIVKVVVMPTPPQSIHPSKSDHPEVSVRKP